MERSPPPLLGTLETALYARDLDQARQFWEGVMGLTAFQSRPGRHLFLRVTDQPRPQVLLIFDPRATAQPADPDSRFPVPPHGATGPGHVCLAVAPDRLDAWRDHLTRSGIPIEADFHWPNGGRSIYVRDPAGNSVELADPAIWS